jgi:predicted ArsR family transcriptional regulator
MMGDQLDIFSTTHARATDPVTSKSAARSMAQTAAAQADILYWSMVRSGQALTADELAMREKMTIEQVCRRLADLQKQGRAEPTADTRTTRSGRSARVWRVVLAKASPHESGAE